MENLDLKLQGFDQKTINWAKRVSMPFSRLAIFVVYFWFGALKVFGESPANPLVAGLLAKTLPGVPFSSFIIALGVLEMIIGIIFVIPNFERLAIFILAFHLVMILIPLILLPQVAWSGFFVPTLEGQYMIKNILIIAIAINILSSLRPLEEKLK